MVDVVSSDPNGIIYRIWANGLGAPAAYANYASCLMLGVSIRYPGWEGKIYQFDELTVQREDIHGPVLVVSTDPYAEGILAWMWCSDDEEAIQELQRLIANMVKDPSSGVRERMYRIIQDIDMATFRA